MRRNVILYRKYLILLILLLLWTVFPVKIPAKEPVDLERKASIIIEYPLSGIKFQVYRVADVSEDGVYTKTTEFESYAVNLEQQEQTGWRALASTLAGHVIRDEKQPLETKMTGAEGRVDFDELKAGLYLIIGEEKEVDGYRYEVEPALIALPDIGEDDAWNYDVTAAPKYERQPVQPDGATIRKKVIKIWKDNNYKKRPKEITVQLIKDGKVEDTVILKEENNWKYQWDNLDATASWQVTEQEIPEGYTVTVEKDGDTFSITNTRKMIQGGRDSGTGKNYIPGKQRLPQTGQLWWPVGILSVAGLLLFGTGWMRRNHR